MVNIDNGTATDYMDLIRYVQKVILEKGRRCSRTRSTYYWRRANIEIGKGGYCERRTVLKQFSIPFLGLEL